MWIRAYANDSYKAHVKCLYQLEFFQNQIMESLKEIQQFLTPETPQHLKSIAVTYVLSNNMSLWAKLNIFINRIAFIGLTGSTEGRDLLYKCSETVTALGKLAQDPDPTVSKDALLCLVNLSAEDEGAALLLESVTLICTSINFEIVF